MLLRPLHRHTRKRLAQIFLLFFLIFNVVDVLLVRQSYAKSPAALRRDKIQKRKQGRVYVSAIHWNTEPVLISHWNHAVVALAQALGPENVFVSIYESGSWDKTKGALEQLDFTLGRVGVRRKFVLDNTTHEEEVSKPPGPTGWVTTSRGRKELRRVPYLAKLRNLTLKSLKELQLAGEVFDRVLFLNDVVFSVDDILRLLDTNGGKYATACALDFSKPPQFYDTFALRDSEGHESVMLTWPYFRSRRSRYAIKYNKPVPVASCWNGIAAMDASPFYNAVTSLEFRGIPDSLATAHVEASECCLIHADNPLSLSKGIWLNPAVRVGYSGPAYESVRGSNSIDSKSRNLPTWLTTADILLGLWKNRLSRWLTSDRLRSSVVRKRLAIWGSNKPENIERGDICLINEMQVLIMNGWEHV